MYYTFENFINYCDRNEISLEPANESLISSIKEKLKKFLLMILNGLDKLLSKGKDNKIKSKIRELISRAKKALGEVEQAETQEDLNKVNNDAKDIKKETEKVKEEVSESNTPKTGERLETNSDGEKFKYNKDGKLEYVIDKNGKKHIMSKSGRLIPEGYKEGPNGSLIKDDAESREREKKAADELAEAKKQAAIKNAENKKKYEEKLKSYNIKDWRYVFLHSLDVDPTFTGYQKMYSYATKKFPDLFEDHKDLTPFTNNPREMTIKYWENIEIDLLHNFSKKRFDYMRKIAPIVYKDKVKRLLKERAAKKH